MVNDRIKRAGTALTLIGMLICVIGLIMLINVPSITILTLPEYGEFTMADPYKTREVQTVMYTGMAISLIGVGLQTYAYHKKN